MPFHKGWRHKRRHSSFCSSLAEIPVGRCGGGAHSANTATTSIITSTAEGVGGSISGVNGGGVNSLSHKNSVTYIDGSTVIGVPRRCSELQQQQHVVVMDIIDEDKVEVQFSICLALRIIVIKTAAAPTLFLSFKFVLKRRNLKIYDEKNKTSAGVYICIIVLEAANHKRFCRLISIFI